MLYAVKSVKQDVVSFLIIYYWYQQVSPSENLAQREILFLLLTANHLGNNSAHYTNILVELS